MLAVNAAVDTAVDTYMADGIDVYDHNDVQVLVGGQEYFPALKAAIDAVPDDKTGIIYLTGWWFELAFSLEGDLSAATTPNNARMLIDVLKAKAHAGVDVRVLGWVMAPELLESKLLRLAMKYGVGGELGDMMKDLIDLTIKFIKVLREEPNLAPNAQLNVLSHPAGAVHMKFALVGTKANAVGFTGGMDMLNSRWDEDWHDVAVRVTGPALEAFFTTFQAMWNENANRETQTLRGKFEKLESHPVNTLLIGDKRGEGITGTAGQFAVQNLRTIPRMKFSKLKSIVLPKGKKISYAPDGLFQFRDALADAIPSATRYLYTEDQGFTSEEIFAMMNDALKTNDQLKVIIVTGVPDPGDAQTVVDTNAKLFASAIRALIDGIPDGELDDRISVISHYKTIHSKLTLIDDKWALIGSANSMRRSLYTDFEHAVAYVHEDVNSSLAAHRVHLWEPHLELLANDGNGNIPNLATALGLWFDLNPGQELTTGSGFTLLRRIDVRDMLAVGALTSKEQAMVDLVIDADSTKTWGKNVSKLI